MKGFTEWRIRWIFVMTSFCGQQLALTGFWNPRAWHGVWNSLDIQHLPIKWIPLARMLSGIIAQNFIATSTELNCSNRLLHSFRGGFLLICVMVGKCVHIDKILLLPLCFLSDAVLIKQKFISEITSIDLYFWMFGTSHYRFFGKTEY